MVEADQAAERLDSYTIGRELGRGTYGSVFHAQGEDGTEYAIKIFNYLYQDMSQEEIKEVQAMQDLADHPNIVRCIEYKQKATLIGANGDTSVVNYAVMEFVKAG